MKKGVFARFESFILFLSLVIPLLYCFIVFIPIPAGIATGLDSSWQYAISRAAVDKLIFGKDIIFTYGPLGYLLSGAVLDQNFFLIVGFRYTVYLALFVVTFIKITKLKTNLQKISLTLSLLFPFLMGITTDYQLLFIFLILLSSTDSLSEKLIRWWSLGLGIFAGFCLLTKFTLGLSTSGSLILFFSASFFSSSNSNLNKKVRFFALIDSLLAAISVSYILFTPEYYLSNFKKVLICIVFSGTAGVGAWFIQQRLTHKALLKAGENLSNKKVLSSKSHSQLFSWCVFYVLYCFCLFTVILHSSPFLIDYLRSSLEFSSGYSSAMSIVGSPLFLIAAVSELVLISILLFLIAREGSVGFSLASLLIVFFAFKHGFARQDSGHIFLFAFCTPFIVALCIPKLKTPAFQRFSYLLHFYVLIVAFMFRTAVMGGAGIQEALAPSRATVNWSVLSHLTAFKSYLKATSATSLAGVKLPENVANLVTNKTVDIIPWEISLVEANKLNWKPRPIFQSYSAYTTYLDNINFESLSREHRDYIFYNFSSIDGRHPFFDEPKTFSYVFCNYKISSDVPEFTSTSSLLNLMILEKRNSSICSSSTLSKSSLISWNTSHSIEASDGLINRAKVKFNYSKFGKIYKTLFRNPPVMIEVVYTDGLKQSYRIIPENSDNGIIISHLPRNEGEAMSFFQGQLPVRVKSFSFHASNALLYSPKIEISFLSNNVLYPSIKQLP